MATVRLLPTNSMRRYDSAWLAVQFGDGRLQGFMPADDVASATWTIRPSATAAPETLRYAIDSDGAVWLDGRFGGDAVRMRLRPVDPRQFPLLRKR